MTLDVTIPQEDVGTFLDYRLPLHERLARLATLIQSDAWSASMAHDASKLICEAADRLSRIKAEDAERIGMFAGMSNQNHLLQKEMDRMRREHARELFVLEQELLSLKEDD